MENTETNVSNIISKDCLVYSLLGDFSEENKQKIATLQHVIRGQFSDVVWETPPSALHITLLVLISSLEGDSDADTSFSTVFPEYHKTISTILRNYPVIEVSFNEIKVTQDAIILVGKDKGEFQNIREAFMKSISLRPKQPNIIHATIARFTQSYPLDEIDDFLKTQTIRITERIHRFKLPRETKKPMLEFEVRKYYELGSI